MKTAVRQDIKQVVANALVEDLGPTGSPDQDVTSQLLANRTRAKASIVAKASGVIAGLECVREVFRQLDESVEVFTELSDGLEISADTVVCKIEGPLHALLAGERTALNLLSHLSGVATATRKLVDLASPVLVYDTRKTLPGLRALQKAAVLAGGGMSNRASLSEAILIKDNHIAVDPDITSLVTRGLSTPLNVEVECETLHQVVSAVEAGAHGILIDNRSIQQTRQLVDAARQINPNVIIEASGGITIDSIADVAKTGVDRISVGGITHSVASLDFSMEVAPCC